MSSRIFFISSFVLALLLSSCSASSSNAYPTYDPFAPVGATNAVPAIQDGAVVNTTTTPRGPAPTRAPLSVTLPPRNSSFGRITPTPDSPHPLPPPRDYIDQYSRYFKYVLTITLMIVVARILVYLIGIIAFPKANWLIRQYREAYERFLCPVCNYPIRVGPRKFLYWTRRTVHKILPQHEFVGKDEAYTCPACGTELFEQCTSCQHIRHSLLFHCDHCGAIKEVK